jgi:hypothetical protein
MLCAILGAGAAARSLPAGGIGVRARPARRGTKDRGRVMKEAPRRQAPVADRLGITHVDGKYHFTDGDFLNEGADRALALGTRVLKVWFISQPASKYPFNSHWPAVHSLVELARTPYFRALFAKPFTTFILETFAFGRDDQYWRLGITAAEAADETRQFEALARYLLTTYRGTGKSFVLQNWEGDWAIRGNFDPKQEPTPTAVAGMIRWLNARQEGVNRARRAVRATGVHVYHAAEVSGVADAMAGRTSVTNNVLPHTRCDLYSYSAYDTSIQGTHFREALDYIAAHAPASASFGARNVYVGEFGVPENEFGTAFAVASVRKTIEEALQWGCPYVVYWQLYDNECRHGTSDAKGDCRGFWLIEPSGRKSPLWDVLRGFLRSPGR